MHRVLRIRLILFCKTLSVLLGISGSVAGEVDGRAIYNFRCYFCHGYSGDARTLAAELLDPKPRDFTIAEHGSLTRERMLEVVREGIAGTAMRPFRRQLTEAEMTAVVDFVRAEFMERKAPNTRYHTRENGWPDHERYAAAFPFVRGEIPLASPEGELTPEQAKGRRLYLNSCVSCHDFAKRLDARGDAWRSEAVSYPRVGFATGDFLLPPDAVTGASPYARHDNVPVFADLTDEQRRGERIYQENCAFCHAADGTGMNWIGTFLQPNPRNLTDATVMRNMTRDRLQQVIRNGLPGSSMPAWGQVLDDGEIQAIVSYIDRAFHPLAD